MNLGDDRFGFVETRSVRDANGAVHGFKPSLTHSPPLLDVTPAKLVTRENHVRIEGQANDSGNVMDTFVFVGPRKAFYQSNKKAMDPTKLKFSFDAELNAGVNVITVVARENDDTLTRSTMIVRRDGPNRKPLPATKSAARAKKRA